MSAQMEDYPAELDPIESIYSLPEYPDSKVRHWETDEKLPERTTRGTIFTDYVELGDGHSYPVVIGLPKRSITDVPVAYTTAWWTSTHGHNRHTLMRFMERGIPGVMIGSEGVHRRPGERRFRPGDYAEQLGSIALSQSAHNMHEILDALPLRRSGVFDTAEIALLGKSRGAMVGMGVLAYAPQYGRAVSRAYLTAPCFPKKLELSDMPEMIGQVITEPRQAAKFIGHLSLIHLRHYPSTVDLHPKAVAFQLATGPALINGEAGDMARLILPNQHLEITTYKGDFASMPKRWDEIFVNNPNYSHIILDGAHLALADEETIIDIEAKVTGSAPPRLYLIDN